jgi:hypothetical protein
MRNYLAIIIHRSIRLCRFHATPCARSSHARADIHAAAAVPPPPPPPPPTLAIRDYPASTTDRSIRLGIFPAMPCARSSHARADMNAAAVVPPPLCPEAFEPQVAPTPAGPQGRRRQDGDKSRCTCWLDANGWRRPRGAVELPPPPPLLSLYLSLSLAPLLRAVSPRRISLVCTIGQDIIGNGELILHVFLCKFRCSR